MKTAIKTLREEALELQDFFLGSYEEKVLQAALDSGNNDLLGIAVAEAKNHQALIEEQEDDHSN